MKSIEIPVNLTLPESRTPRSEGVHVSSVIRCIATETGILKPEWAEELSLVDKRDITDPTAILRISVGLAWEEYYIPTHLGPVGVVDHPGEMCVQDIYMTHDGESLDVIITDRRREIALVVHEVKATWKSTKTVGDMTSQWLYLTQIKAYCKGLNTRFAKIHILFMCGDYTYPIKPQIKCWLLEFTQEEIDDNFELLTEYRDHRLRIEAGE
jgi:hypothetical protein